MTDGSDEDGTGSTAGTVNGDKSGGVEPLEEVVAAFLRDVDSAHEDYDRGYVDADATLSVVMTHVEQLRDAHDAE
ncbi:hypothetical protein [Halobellus sp. GM3]|uniref:hypothetical protein n=1 Tax=Halobellus sp. GM3 TaxID=3458410 RepID=UPI00403DB1AD